MLTLFKKKTTAVKNMIDYIEGRLTTDFFWNLYIHDSIYMELIGKVANKGYTGYIDENDIKKIESGKMTFFQIVGFQASIDRYLSAKKKIHKINVKELLLFRKWKNVIPSFLDGVIDIYFYLEKIDPNKEKSKKWHRENLLTLYKCEKYPPRWLQFCEWPNDGEEPCVFLFQDGFPNKHDFINYHFRKKDGSEVIISQYD